VGLAAYVGVQVWLRTEWRQKRSIRKRLMQPEDVGAAPGSTGPGDEAALWLSRPERLAFLRACIEGTPAGPLVVTGPEGSGKSTLIRQAVQGRAMCWWLDCREIPVSDGAQLLDSFVNRTGFLPPPDELLGQMVFARGRMDDAKSRREMDKALRLITIVLREVQTQQVEAARVLAATPAPAAAAAAAAAADREDARVAAESRTSEALASLGSATGDEASVAEAAAIEAKRLAEAAAAASAARPGKASKPSPRAGPQLAAAAGRESDKAELGPHSDVRLRQAAESVVEALGRAKARRAGEAPDASQQRDTGPGAWIRGSVFRALVMGAEAAGAVAPAWARRVTDAIRSSAASMFSVEFAEDDSLSALPSTTAPLICLDEVHIIGDASDEHLHALLDWMQYLTDQRLAHVVIGCSADFAEALDATRSFRNRRQRIHVDFPRSVSVKRFLTGPVNAELERRSRAARAAVAIAQAVDSEQPAQAALSAEEVAAFSGLDELDVDWLTSLPPEDLPAAARLRALSAAEVQVIVQTVGGHMKDLDGIIRQLIEGHSLSAVLERMVADSVDSVETFIETTLLRGEPLLPGMAFAANPHAKRPAKGGGGGVPETSELSDAMVARAWRFVRLWRLMEQLAKRKYVSRRELTTGLFAGHGWELDELTTHGIVMCANLRSTRKLRAPTTKGPVDVPPAQAVPPAAGVAASPPAAPAPAPTPPHVPEMMGPDAFSAATRYVAAASPRLRASFRVITENKSLREQSDRVAAMLRAGMLRARLGELNSRLTALAAERSYYAHRVEKFSDTLDPPGWGVPLSPASSWSSGVTHNLARRFEGADAGERKQVLRHTLERLEDDARSIRAGIDDALAKLEHAETVAEGPTRANLLLSPPEPTPRA